VKKILLISLVCFLLCSVSLTKADEKTTLKMSTEHQSAPSRSVSQELQFLKKALGKAGKKSVAVTQAQTKIKKEGTPKPEATSFSIDEALDGEFGDTSIKAEFAEINLSKAYDKSPGFDAAVQRKPDVKKLAQANAGKKIKSKKETKKVEPQKAPASPIRPQKSEVLKAFLAKAKDEENLEIDFLDLGSGEFEGFVITG